MSHQYDPEEAVSALRKADGTLGALIEQVGPFTLEPRADVHPFHALFRSIIGQQLSGKAASTIFGRVIDLFPGDEPPTPTEVLETPDEHFRAAGMSRAKVTAVKDLAAKTNDGLGLSRAALAPLDDKAVIERLTTVRGIGRWTVEMLLLFYLGRPDVFPVTDLGIRKGFMQTYGLEELPRPGEVATYGERWRPYRSVASWYLWRALD